MSLLIKVRRKTWVRWMKTAIAAPTGTKSMLEPRGCSGRADAFAACLVCFARKGITLGFFLALTMSSHLFLFDEKTPSRVHCSDVGLGRELHRLVVRI